MTREARHWIEYGVVFVIITAVATATAAWYTRKEWQSTTDNGRRQRRAYVFPDQDLRQQHHSGRLRGRPQGACHGVDRPADHRAGSRPSRRRPTPTTPLSSRRRFASWRRARPRRQARDGPPSVSEGPEAKLLIARQAFLCAAQLSEIAAWLAENGDSPAATTIQTCADGVIWNAEMVKKGAERDMWLQRNQPPHPSEFCDIPGPTDPPVTCPA